MRGIVSYDTIPAIVAGAQACQDIAQMTADLALARDDGTGVYADACRYQLAQLDSRLAVVRACLNALPHQAKAAA